MYTVLIISTITLFNFIRHESDLWRTKRHAFHSTLENEGYKKIENNSPYNNFSKITWFVCLKTIVHKYKYDHRNGNNLYYSLRVTTIPSRIRIRIHIMCVFVKVFTKLFVNLTQIINVNRKNCRDTKGDDL